MIAIFLYFRSEDGQDFYESLSKFTRKIQNMRDSENIIPFRIEDVSSLSGWFFSCWVNKLPAGFCIYGDWQYKKDCRCSR